MSNPHCTCDPYDPEKPCAFHEAKARALLREMSGDRDYDPELTNLEE